MVISCEGDCDAPSSCWKCLNTPIQLWWQLKSYGHTILAGVTFVPLPLHQSRGFPLRSYFPLWRRHIEWLMMQGCRELHSLVETRSLSSFLVLDSPIYSFSAISLWNVASSVSDISFTSGFPVYPCPYLLGLRKKDCFSTLTFGHDILPMRWYWISCGGDFSPVLLEIFKHPIQLWC